MFEFYEKAILPKSESSQMPFKTFIDDICYRKAKKVNIFSVKKKEVKERAYTFTHNSEVPLENWRNKKSIDYSVNNKNERKYSKKILKNQIEENTQKLKVKN